MSEWIERLADVDDDYLIGISNKGIVKRAYKDKGESAAEVQSLGDEAVVKVAEETVTIRFPLGESKCSCPSRSICRHVVQAILTLRESTGEGTAQEEMPGQAERLSPEETVKAEEGAQQPEKGTVKAEEGAQQPEKGTVKAEERAPQPEKGTVKAEESAQQPGKEAVKVEEKAQQLEKGTVKAEEKAPQPEKEAVKAEESTQQLEKGTVKAEEKALPPGEKTAQERAAAGERLAQGERTVQTEAFLQKGNALSSESSLRPAASDKVRQEIEEYPLPILKKTLGSRQFQNFVSQVLSEVRPQIQYASIITVRLPNRESGAEMVVKLLSPLEYSACTCHKKELCVHKAAAILWCKLDSGKLTREELTDEAAGELSYDMDRVQDAAEQMKLFLEELLGTGLSRTSPDVLDHMERLAVISHNAGLAKFEGYFRALFDSYNGYFKRKASFQTEDLMGQITRLYRRVKLLQQAKDSAEVKQYAGEFRAEYIPVGRLNLIGIGLEHFNSQSGYEGETVYFLEENTKKWYTYTSARPVFYEAGRKRKFTEKAQAPWGLGISVEELLKVRISLTGAKCDDRNRLSSSQDTRGEITGEQRLSLSDMEGWYYRDFGKLFSEQIGKRQKAWLAGGSSQNVAELVFVQPSSCEPAEFLQAGQQLSLPLYDGEEREVTIEVTYSKEEAGTIRYLERISEKKLPCFAGKIYLRDGRLRMYPVAVFDSFFDSFQRDEKSSI